jgi:hypothetical protein
VKELRRDSTQGKRVGLPASARKEMPGAVRIRCNRATLMAWPGTFAWPGFAVHIALDNNCVRGSLSYRSPLPTLLRYCGRVVMASRLGPYQSVMGNLASSNLVSASIFSPSFVDKSAHLRDIVLPTTPRIRTTHFNHNSEMYYTTF